MVMIIIHIAYITCLVTNDAWHAFDVIEIYNTSRSWSGLIFHGASNTVGG